MNKRTYCIGGVDVTIEWKTKAEQYNHKLRVLKMAMDNWHEMLKKYHHLSIDSPEGIKYTKDCDEFNKINALTSQDKWRKKHMKLMNEMFIRYNQ
jgi:hypothetical protein